MGLKSGRSSRETKDSEKLQTFYPTRGSSASQFRDDLSRRLPGLLHRTDLEANGADAGMPAAPVALANRSQIERHRLVRPRVRSHRNLGPEAGRAHRHGVDRLRKQ